VIDTHRQATGNKHFPDRHFWHASYAKADWDAARAVTQRLEAYAQALKQDPQVEGVLRTRGAEFGVEKGSRLERVVQSPEVTERLMRQVGLEQARGRDHGPSLGM
jgi:hypothetical protein